ncbi:hypothetical protein C8A05DRAFT_42397 [Staphylotrichum tortipilum]|uniref:Uncharacterized protein n=1 Tax=Staphylotrichum tortipilum TaxID=2831512 RepID=A0AAN6RW07_9PEZI|nr:hypothetical protein C8A05DRAFT_42397 [Staphylotrichum longicolle]
MPPRRPPKKVSRAARGPSLPTPVHSSQMTSLSLTYPSTYASETEDGRDGVSTIPIHALTLSDPANAPAERPPRKQRRPFRFLDLPSELRIEIYMLHFEGSGRVIDLDSDNYKLIYRKLAILWTCRAIYHEASHVFYATRTFRIFPTQPGRFFKTKKPLLARLTPSQRRSLTSLELRLGPGWNKPPRGWVVNAALGLAGCVNVRRLAVFVECDPSDNVFKGFRKADGFYEGFSRNLLDAVLAEMPFVDRVHFDAWSSVKKNGAMMTGLVDVARARGRTICWGPERNWTDDKEESTMIAFLNSSEYRLG